jgi:predicted nucleotidyltransferase
MAPMEFQQLVDSQITDKAIKEEIEKLLERKKAGDELKEGARIPILNDFIEAKIEKYNKVVQDIGKIDLPNTYLLDDLFKKTIAEVW